MKHQINLQRKIKTVFWCQSIIYQKDHIVREKKAIAEKLHKQFSHSNTSNINQSLRNQR